MRTISRSSITALFGLTLLAPFVGCVQTDDEATEGEELEEGQELEELEALEELEVQEEVTASDERVADKDPDRGGTDVAAAYCPQGKTTDVIKTVVWPNYPVFGGTSATAPSTAYWNDSDGTFTMRAGGILNMPYHAYAGASYHGASDFNHSTKAACEDLFLGYEIWAYRASTGCYEYRGAGSRRGVWTVAPYTGTHCSLSSPAFDIDTDVYSYVKVSTYAYTNTPIPSSPNIHFQAVLRPTAFVNADFE